MVQPASSDRPRNVASTGPLHAVDQEPNVNPCVALPYVSSNEHIQDLLCRLDLQIRRELLRSAPKDATVVPHFAAITDAEIQCLLGSAGDAGVAAPSAEPCPPTELLELEVAIVDAGARIDARAAVTPTAPRLRLTELVRRFELSDFERDLLLVCLASELDRKYERIYGYLQDDMSRRRPTAGLAIAICCPSGVDRAGARALLMPGAPLLEKQLLELVQGEPDAQPFPARSVCVNERIVQFLCECSTLDARAREWLTPVPLDASVALSVSEEPWVKRALAWCAKQRDPALGKASPIIHVCGSSAHARQRLALQIAAGLGVRSMLVDMRGLAASSLGIERALALAFREGLLESAGVILENLDQALNDDPSGARTAALVRCLDRWQQTPTFLLGEHAIPWTATPSAGPALVLELPRPGYGDHLAVWRAALASVGDFPVSDIAQLASVFPVSPPQASAAVLLARAAGAVKEAGGVELSDVARICRQQSAPAFGRLARRVDAVKTWDDLVVPTSTLDELKDVCVQAKYRCMVHGEWGFGRKVSPDGGLPVLLAGPSGTGKTMAAEVIANDLGLDLYAIDLSQVVSKYIGETEKNLNAIFASARAANIILFFDEADALLGKRSEVKDSHDRYANIEVAYLLQKMEEYAGITILATNLRQNLDDAFSRRLRFIIEFPLPSEADRLRIWNRIFPAEAPLAPDVDRSELARQYRLTGGNIRNVALSAAFIAAAEGQAIGMKHLALTARRELRKIGRLLDPEPVG